MKTEKSRFFKIKRKKPYYYRYKQSCKIEKGKHDELFERFYRADSSRNSETGGHGIGLSVVKAIANAHKGKAICYSNDENSITFKITL